MDDSRWKIVEETQRIVAVVVVVVAVVEDFARKILAADFE